jgi:coenzyme F420 biosynthesis associated uncharacterized protein
MPGAIDWALAERVGVKLCGTEPFADSYHYASVAPSFAEHTPLAEVLVTAQTGLVSSLGPAVGAVVDRADWVRANIASFQIMLRPLLNKLESRIEGKNAVAAALTARVTGAEIGAMLGWMSGRVLGQYDVLSAGPTDDASATGSAQATGDRVYYVGPNVLAVEKRFGFSPREFRLWLALHEVTHRAQFTGVPWMRDHFMSLTHQVLESVDPDPSRLTAAAKALIAPGLNRRQIVNDGGLFALFATPEQREVLASIGGMMALLEGHGDIVMNRAGQGLVPSAERFDRVLKQRRAQASPAIKLVQKLAGLEAKMNQYQLGEEFIEAIERAGGERIVDRCWESPDHLPTMDEIRDPQQWLRRLHVPASV